MGLCFFWGLSSVSKRWTTLEAHGGYSYCGLAALCIAGRADALDLHSFLRWAVNKQMSHEGGFQATVAEHLVGFFGFLLWLLGRLFWDIIATCMWLSFREGSGLWTMTVGAVQPFMDHHQPQGRANKLVDSCYSFWQGAIFPLLHEAFRQSQQIKLPEDHCWFKPEPLQMYILLACQHPNGGLRDKPTKSADFYHTCYALSGMAVSQYLGCFEPFQPVNFCVLVRRPSR